MNIVIEGPDGSGKTTLINMIAQCVPLTIQSGEGPARGQEEIVSRAVRYMKMDHTLFDRHPCVSEPIYGKFRQNPHHMPLSYLRYFYQSRPLFIYCYGYAGGNHERKSYDTDDHMELVKSNDTEIRNLYHLWAEQRVPLDQWYCLEDHDVNDTREHILNLCQEFCQ